MDLDPETGYLWDTENGPGFGDEINLVEPGFNSGWAKIQGISPITNYDLLNSLRNRRDILIPRSFKRIREFGCINNTGKYSGPELSLNEARGVTAT